MSTDASLAFKALTSSTRITFGLIPGLGVLVLLRMAIHLYRPDIEDAEHRVRDHPFDQLHECYDFIVIGGGSAGAVVASRLSENPEWKVLLLEAGQDENVLSDVPALFPTLQISSIDWQFETEPSNGYCLNMVNGKCKWPRGKVLGGSSAVNAMLYIRGNKRDYDNWERLGNIGWAYKDVFEYFLRSEDMRITEFKDNLYHAKGGPLTIEHYRYEQPITSKILEAGMQMGYQILDVNGEFQTGFTRSQATVRDGLRCSTAKAFLRVAAKRPNLHVSVHSFVEKIVIDEHKTAYGVKFVKYGQERIVKVSKEVILSAGSIQSPQLLMLSGIGDAYHLKELGINPIAHLPGIGQNLQDHVAMGGHSFLFDNPYRNGSDYSFNLNSVMTLNSLVDFSVNRKGLFYSMMEAEAMAFVNTKYQDPTEDYPDVQMFIAPTADNMDGGLFGKRANGLTDETYAALYEDILYEPSFSVVPLVLRPKSRGFIKLKDANPYTPPIIVPNYFSAPEDLQVMIEGARIVQELINQPALKELNSRPNPRRNPGCADHELMSDEHLECQARHHTMTIYHPVGTCAMGPADNPEAVVDPRLRVYGINKLRVVDGSIMPTITSGNTNAPIIMIAEKASDMIKEDWNENSIDQATTCPVEYHEHSKSSEDSTLQSYDIAKPDFFNETGALFSYYIEPYESKEKVETAETAPNTNKISLLAKEYRTKHKGIVPENEEATYSDLNDNHFNIDTPLLKNYKDYVIANFPTADPSPMYPIQPYPYWYPSFEIGRLLPEQPIYQDPLKSYYSNPYMDKTYTKYRPYNDIISYNTNNQPKKYKPFKYKPNYKSGTRHGDKQNVYYETQDVLTPSRQKTCKVWLDYDGVKYEVNL